MIGSVLVVCVGNICRSPMGERLLTRALPGLVIGSAGLSAVVGSEADFTSQQAASDIGLDLGGHVARQLTAEIGAAYDLILVMEPRHRTELTRRFPQLSGRTMAFDHWVGGKGIADPYRKPLAAHCVARDAIAEAADAWAVRLCNTGT